MLYQPAKIQLAFHGSDITSENHLRAGTSLQLYHRSTRVFAWITGIMAFPLRLELEIEIKTVADNKNGCNRRNAERLFPILNIPALSSSTHTFSEDIK